MRKDKKTKTMVDKNTSQKPKDWATDTH